MSRTGRPICTTPGHCKQCQKWHRSLSKDRRCLPCRRRVYATPAKRREAVARHEWKLACIDRGECLGACSGNRACRLLPDSVTGADLPWIRAGAKADRMALALEGQGFTEAAETCRLAAQQIRDRRPSP